MEKFRIIPSFYSSSEKQGYALVQLEYSANY